MRLRSLVVCILCIVGFARGANARVALLALNPTEKTLEALPGAAGYEVTYYDVDLTGVDFGTYVANRVFEYCHDDVSHVLAIDFMTRPMHIVGPIDCRSVDVQRDARLSVTEWEQWPAPVPDRLGPNGVLIWLDVVLNHAYESLPLHGPCHIARYRDAKGFYIGRNAIPEIAYLANVPLPLCWDLDDQPIAPISDYIVLSELDGGAGPVLAGLADVNQSLANVVARFLMEERIGLGAHNDTYSSSSGRWSTVCTLSRGGAESVQVDCESTNGDKTVNHQLRLPLRAVSAPKKRGTAERPMHIVVSERATSSLQLAQLLLVGIKPPLAQGGVPTFWRVFGATFDGPNTAPIYIGRLVMKGRDLYELRYMNIQGAQECVMWLEGSSSPFTPSSANIRFVTSIGATAYASHKRCGAALPQHF